MKAKLDSKYSIQLVLQDVYFLYLLDFNKAIDEINAANRDFIHRLLPYLDKNYLTKNDIYTSKYAKEAIVLSKRIFRFALSSVGMKYKVANNKYPFKLTIIASPFQFLA